MVERAGQREEVERLYSNGEYRQVAELLWITLKAEPTAEDQTPIPQERANQLKLLLSSLHELEESDQPRSYAQGIERVLLEIAVRIRARHSLPDWVNGAGQILQLIVQKHHNAKLATLAGKFTMAELGRLFRSLSSIAAAQMELGPEPAVPVRSLTNVWILGYELIKSFPELLDSDEQERKTSSESQGSDASETNDPYEMKNLKYFPELSTMPHVQLLITAHHELGSCSWCGDSNHALLKFILRELSNQKRMLEKKALDSSNDYTRELALLSTEISQALFCFIQFPSKKPKGIQDHRPSKSPLTWADVDLILSILTPELPSFDSLKSMSITTDLAGLLKKIIKLAPDSAYDNHLCIQLAQLGKYMEDQQFRESHGSEWLKAKSATKHELSAVYYMMGDYFMKNGDKTQALKNYQLDACFNPDRFDTWAAIALCKAAEIEDNLRSFEHDDKLDQRKIEATVFAFTTALTLEENGKIMIEFGQFVYYIGARVMRTEETQGQG